MVMMEEDGTTAQLTGTTLNFLNETTCRSDLIEVCHVSN